MAEANMSISELVRMHDEEPDRAAQGLRAMAAAGVAEQDMPQFAWLVNHVIGEKQGAWREALQLQQALPAGGPLVLRLQRAAAALLAGEAVEAWALQARIAGEAQVPPDQARAAVQLRAMQYLAERAEPCDFAAALRDCVQSVPSGAGTGKLGAALATSMNNTVSALVEREDLPVNDPDVSATLLEGAQAARRLWGDAGNWTNHERADYLIALCGNRVGEWAVALQAARNGIATIEANGSEDVDRAFLLLEVARASHGLGDEATRASAKAEAMKLAESFDASLHDWFNGCAKRA